MKKLLTIIASAAATMFAFGAGADFTESGTSLEGYPTNVLQTAKDDSGTGTGYQFWYSAVSAADAAEAFVITNYESAGVAVPTLAQDVTRPDLFAPSNNASFLMIETTDDKRLFRTALRNTQDPTAFEQVEIPDDGIYLDTLVKFTAADDEFKSDLEGGDKIAIEYVDQTTDDTIENPIKAFVIRAGYVVGGQITQTNYCAYPANDPNFENFDKGAWHRLTVRAIPELGTAGAGSAGVGFVVYLDQVPLVYGLDVAPGDAAYTAKFNTTITSSFYKEDRHAIYPSIVDAQETLGKKISAVSFSGNGSVDDVVFTTATPKFIEASESVVATINLGTGISGVTVTVAGEPVAPIESGVNPLVFNLDPGTTTFTLAVTPDEANGYRFDADTGFTAVNASYDNGTVTISGGAPTVTVVGKRDNAYYMDGETKVGFATLSEAFANAPANATIKLGYDYVAGDMEAVSDSAPVFVIAKNVVLDLNGKELDGGSSNARALFSVNNGCSLTVIDSVAGDDGSIVYGGTFGMFAGKGVTIIGSADDCGPVINGAVIGNKGYVDGVVRGKFTAADNTAANGKFVCATDEEDEYEIPYGIDVVDSDSTVTLVGDYWVVEPAGGSATFALTTTGGENAEIVTDPAVVSALTVATSVTITATATNGFTYATVDLDGTDWTYNSNADAISMTTNISENTEIVVPDAVAEQPSDDWPTGQDLDDAAGKAAGDLFPGITNALATADAKAVATWAEAKGVDYADKGSILPEAFLLNCANTQEAIDAAAANFKITAITVDGDTVTITPADASTYGNGKVVIEGTATLSPISWHEKTAGDHFFRATLVVDPVAVP